MSLTARSSAATAVALAAALALVPGLYALFSALATFFGVVWVAGWLMQVVRRRFFYETVDPTGKAVFVTGCDSGFGNSLARRLDAQGFRVFAACLDPSGGGATALQADASQRLTTLPLDVTNAESVTSAKQFVVKSLADDEELWCVVNNAGIPQSGEVEWVPMEDMERVMDVNALGTVRVTKTFLPLVRRAKGRIVNVTSAVGKFICGGYVGYCMSKAAGIAFCKGLRVEMMKWGVKVISIEPFFYRTQLTTPDMNTPRLESSWQRADPEVKADYGDEYIRKLQARGCKYLDWVCCNRVDQVVECLEDAVTSSEPLASYYPAYLPHKLGIQLLDFLPQVITNHIQRYVLDGRGLPAALLLKKSQ